MFDQARASPTCGIELHRHVALKFLPEELGAIARVLPLNWVFEAL